MNIKRKLTLLILIFILVTANLFAQKAGSVNYFTPLIDNKEYSQLIKGIFDDEGLDKALANYEVLVEKISSYKYEPWMQDLALSRACMIVAKYATEVKPERKDVATAYMTAADKLLKSGRDKGAPESAGAILEALSNSFWYLIDGSLSKGMAFTKLVDEAYKAHPEDFHVLLMAADRYLHSPGIAGGSRKKGLSLFEDAEKLLEEQKVAIWDRFTIYSGLAYGHWKRKNKSKALEYALLAKDIYKADSTINEIIADLT